MSGLNNRLIHTVIIQEHTHTHLSKTQKKKQIRFDDIYRTKKKKRSGVGVFETISIE